MHTVHLIGSGPSARPAFPACCVNASWGLLPATAAPGVHVFGEMEAAMANPAAVMRSVHFGSGVWMRPTAKDALRAKVNSPLFAEIYEVDLDFGPACLRHLHDDVSLPTGERNVWISSGVLALWVLAHVYKPGRVVISGLDGYPADPAAPVGDDARQGNVTIGGEYAAQIPALPSRPARSAAWCAAMNDRMAEGIDAITNHYTQTQFEFVRKPRHWRNTWRAAVKG